MSESRGVAMIEVALVLPLLVLLLIGGMFLGLATVDSIRLERTAGDAALLAEGDARALVAAVGGRVLCWWSGDNNGGCFDDGLTISRVQLVAEGRTWVYPTGRVTPTAYVTRPTEGDTNG